jgi:hypothetical protein
LTFGVAASVAARRGVAASATTRLAVFGQKGAGSHDKRHDSNQSSDWGFFEGDHDFLQKMKGVED